jgi:hypothetical protein
LKPSDSRAESLNIPSIKQVSLNNKNQLSKISANFEMIQNKHDHLGSPFLTDRLRLKSGLSDRDLKYLASISAAYS